MRLRVGRAAQRQIDRIERWWAENRSVAPDLFTDELEQTLRAICDQRGAGLAWPTEKRPTLRRILMPRTENHVYFEVDETSVHVLAVWGAPRGRGPRV